MEPQPFKNIMPVLDIIASKLVEDLQDALEQLQEMSSDLNKEECDKNENFVRYQYYYPQGS